jgi:DNA-binding CsgD family transcriptional regulator
MLSYKENSKTAVSHTEAARDVQSPDGSALQRPGAAVSPDASELGAAMAHQLSEPVTALLLHVGYIQQNSDRFIDSDGDVDSLKQAIDSAVQAAEQLLGLIDRMGDGFEAPIRPTDDEVRPGMKPLTRREREVLHLVSEGYSNKEGASLLNISYRTFECHRAEVLRKFGARNTAELVRLALFGDRAGPSQRTHRRVTPVQINGLPDGELESVCGAGPRGR